jgi:hypothetical protein
MLTIPFFGLLLGLNYSLELRNHLSNLNLNRQIHIFPSLGTYLTNMIEDLFQYPNWLPLLYLNNNLITYDF